jgi:hypothetical protein
MRTHKQVFVALQKFFHDPKILSTEKIKVWNVLTALRGPDIYSSSLKKATTAVIRQHFLGVPPYTISCAFYDDNKESVKYRKSLYPYNLKAVIQDVHFISHAAKAFNALGLEWTALNPPSKRLRTRASVKRK